MICPNCKAENDDNWPIEVNGEIKDGGCQLCWEQECDTLWWEQVGRLHGLGLLDSGR